MLKMALAEKAMIIEFIVGGQLISHKSDWKVTETDKMMINRLVREEKLTVQETIDEILKNHKN